VADKTIYPNSQSSFGSILFANFFIAEVFPVPVSPIKSTGKECVAKAFNMNEYRNVSSVGIKID
jgi:hypothetical protein